MLNSSESVKSKRGVLLFAFNSGTVNYVSIADSAARLITRYLNLPVTLVTDVGAITTFDYDQVINVDTASGNLRQDLSGNQVEWKNFDRFTAYKLSPYEETLLLDTDYLVLDDSLLKLFDSCVDYRLMHFNRDTKGVTNDSMGPVSLPFVWATILVFKKTEKSKLLFDMVGRIQRNYAYYCRLYNIGGRSYRNDYAFAIANNIVSGYSLNEDQAIPWAMFTVSEKITQVATHGSLLVIRLKDSAVVIPQQSMHVMDKDYLQSQYFVNFVKEMCA